jgi:hypothetical protein
MAAPDVVTPLDGIILEHMSTGGGITLGETSDLGLVDQTMATDGAALPAGGIVFGAVTGWWWFLGGAMCPLPHR